jgi:hypothetical protein
MPTTTPRRHRRLICSGTLAISSVLLAALASFAPLPALAAPAAVAQVDHCTVTVEPSPSVEATVDCSATIAGIDVTILCAPAVVQQTPSVISIVQGDCAMTVTDGDDSLTVNVSGSAIDIQRSDLGIEAVGGEVEFQMETLVADAFARCTGNAVAVTPVPVSIEVPTNGSCDVEFDMFNAGLVKVHGEGTILLVDVGAQRIEFYVGSTEVELLGGLVTLICSPGTILDLAEPELILPTIPPCQLA